MNIEGRFSGTSDIIEVGANRTSKRTFRLDITGNSQYENITEFSLMGDKVNMVEGLKNGQHIEVSFNINGRRWTDPKTNIEKVFSDLQCFGIVEIKREKVQATTTGVVLPPKVAAVSSEEVPAVVTNEDLPEFLKD